MQEPHIHNSPWMEVETLAHLLDSTAPTCVIPVAVAIGGRDKKKSCGCHYPVLLL